MKTVSGRICRAPDGCDVALRDEQFYCRTHFDELLRGLVTNIERFYGRARDIYIGRSHYPEKRLLQHRSKKDLDHLAVLHWAGDRAEIEELETSLIRAFRERLKTLNRIGDSDGRWSGHWYCVYVAWAEKERAGAWPWTRRTPVRHLDYGHRLAPDRRVLVKEPDVLVTTLRRRDVESELEGWRKQSRSA
jgi:hypothetical protein